MIDALARLEVGGEPATHPRGNVPPAKERAGEDGEVSAGPDDPLLGGTRSRERSGVERSECPDELGGWAEPVTLGETPSSYAFCPGSSFSSTGSLIQATVGSSGGVRRRWRNRAGLAAQAGGGPTHLATLTVASTVPCVGMPAGRGAGRRPLVAPVWGALLVAPGRHARLDEAVALVGAAGAGGGLEGPHGAGSLRRGRHSGGPARPPAAASGTWALHIGPIAEGVLPSVPAPIVAEAWRGGPRQARLARMLAGCEVGAMTSGTARRVRELAGRANHDDVVDVAVVEAAAGGDDDVIVTSNEAHIRQVIEATGKPSRTETV